MRDSRALRELIRVVERSGLADSRSDGVVMLSGGADSACLATALTMICGPQSVSALHVNYGLRPEAELAERAARQLCAQLRIDLHFERPRLEGGNLQARARETRHRAAERLRDKLSADWIAVGHTSSDLTETVLYRLAVSPGARAARAMPPASGRLIRPLLGLSREAVRNLAAGAAIPYADDPSNEETVFARNAIRAEVVPQLTGIGPELERNIGETHAEWCEDAELISGLAGQAIEAAGCERGGPLAHEELVAMAPALRRAVLTELAERAAGRPVRIDRRTAAEIVRLSGEPEGGTLELGRGLQARCEAWGVQFTDGEEPPTPDPVALTVPGRARYGSWELRAELKAAALPVAGGPDLAMLDPRVLGRELIVRGWREGDRITPLGMEGSKTLQDLFTDRGVPRSLRRKLPVIEVDGRIAWVAGVAISDEFKLRSDARQGAVIELRSLET